MSKSGFGRLVLMAAACAFIALPAVADSQARIVRLSDVQGSVQINKNSGMGFERAFLNLPITQGAQIQTRDGRAEIEFEDGSTLRLAPNTLAVFDSLGLNDSGARVSNVSLQQGMAYVNWFGKKGDQFALNFSQEKIALDHAAHFRVQVSTVQSQVAVFKGEVEVEGSSDKMTLGKNKMATFAGDEKPVLAGLSANAFDDWDKQAASYHDQYAKNNSTPYGYGASDLNYYGAFQNVAGYGMLWQPYFAGAGWDPFMDGAWSWYPGMGFGFVSAYPWGWLPYHYGNWVSVPGFGWMWQAGNWNSIGFTPRFAGTLPATFRAPVAPTGTIRTVAVGRGGPVASSGLQSRMVVNAGSAGIGVARGSISNLNHLNRQVAKSGSAEVRPAPQFAATSHGSYGSYNGGRAASGAGAGRAGSSTAGASHSSSSMGGSSAGHASSAGGHR